jgi:feruloyl-CoA synthase
VGPLRSKILAASTGYAEDVVITGHDRECVGALVFPNLVACRQLAGLVRDATTRDIAAVVRRFQEIFDALAKQSTGSSTYVARTLLLEEPPSFDTHEITDKGSINQKEVIQHRAALIEELYAASPSPRIIVSEVSIS